MDGPVWQDSDAPSELKYQAGYYRAQHRRAVARADALEREAAELKARCREHERLLACQAAQIEQLQAQLAWHRRQLFGRHSEASPEPAEPAPAEQDVPGSEEKAADAQPAPQRRKRGKQPGAKGHGRKSRKNLPAQEQVHDVPENERLCPKCGEQRPLKDHVESDEITWEVRLVRVVHRRKRYGKACECEGVAATLTAPGPAKLVPKAMFSTDFWCRVLVEKFHLQRPLSRIVQELRMHGLEVSPGTLTGGIKRMAPMLEPLYDGIADHMREATQRHMDETHWMQWGDGVGKNLWWLWVAVTHDTCVFVLDPSRSSKVAFDLLGPEARGILVVDRYSAYKALVKLLGGNVILAFCWAHVRRDFIAIGNGYGKLAGWSQEWVSRIDELFHINARRRASMPSGEQFAAEDLALREAIAGFRQTLDRQRDDTSLHKVQRKALSSLDKHWQGLTVFVEHPEVPMDNNTAERVQRNGVVGRNNYYGSGALWSGTLTAMLFTIFQTLAMNSICPLAFMRLYLRACADNGGKPPDDVQSFLPWNLSPERRAALNFNTLEDPSPT